jgi:hypothetical protein
MHLVVYVKSSLFSMNNYIWCDAVGEDVPSGIVVQSMKSFHWFIQIWKIIYKYFNFNLHNDFNV